MGYGSNNVKQEGRFEKGHAGRDLGRVVIRRNDI
jgi:hypothetical protein